jgi:hypothetical protein
MANREQDFRKSSAGAPEWMIHVARTYECPDCNVDVALRRTPGRAHHWTLYAEHDETCPTYATTAVSA